MLLAIHPQFMSSSARTTVVFIAFLAIAGFFLLTEHRAHLFGALPFILLLACPLLHLFHGHGGHGNHSGPSDDAAARRETPRDAVPPHDHGR